MAALYAAGDGHFLVQSISRCLVGKELYWHALCTNFHAHLIACKRLYLEVLPMYAKLWDSIVEETDPAYMPPEGELYGLQVVMCVCVCLFYY